MTEEEGHLRLFVVAYLDQHPEAFTVYDVYRAYCKERLLTEITPQDVEAALEELENEEFIEPVGDGYKSRDDAWPEPKVHYQLTTASLIFITVIILLLVTLGFMVGAII